MKPQPTNHPTKSQFESNEKPLNLNPNLNFKQN